VTDAGGAGMSWHEGLSVGDETLDGHHKHLFLLLEQLAVVGRNGDEHTVIERVLAELQGYIGYHFLHEETWMREKGFHFLEDHQSSHQVIRSRVEEIAERYAADHDPAIAEELAVFLTGWLIHHIEIEDFAYK
jgi:hemerythrin